MANFCRLPIATNWRLDYKKEVGCRPYILQGIAKRPYIHTNKQPTLYGELSDVPSMYFKLAILAGIGTSLYSFVPKNITKIIIKLLFIIIRLIYLLQRKTAPISRAVKIRLVYTLKSWRFLQDKTYHLNLHQDYSSYYPRIFA